MSHPVTRLYVPGDLGAGRTAALEGGQAHYLGDVLRLAPGAAVALFNGRDGEWRGRIVELGKGRGAVVLEARLREAEAEWPLALLFAPVKRARIDFLVEKATELGVTELFPVWTERTQVERLNLGRLAANAIEAAEQTERLTVPTLHEPEKLMKLLQNWETGRLLLLADESGAAPPIGEALATLKPADPGLALLVGPEGGFSDSELDALRKLAFVKPVGLGPRVLRTDTAALAALAVCQALLGDWRRRRLRRAAADATSSKPLEAKAGHRTDRPGTSP
jgi:16S rRNA (uracil1498-N3)-methyltransferase